MVLGPHRDRIKMMVDTLAVFLTRDERKQSRYAQDGGILLNYAPDLFLQVRKERTGVQIPRAFGIGVGVNIFF